MVIVNGSIQHPAQIATPAELTNIPVYRYLVHGLHFASTFACPELFPDEEAQAAPDVLIRAGPVAEHLDGAIQTGPHAATTRQHHQFHVPGVARFAVHNGNEIVVDPVPGCQAHDLRAYLLGSALGALLHQRRLFVLHASAIATQTGAVLFAGPSGIGKSTLATAFYLRGYRSLTDDVCAVAVQAEGPPQVLPGLCHLKLRSETALALGYAVEDLRRIHSALDKYAVTVQADYRPEAAPLHAIYLLTTTASDEITIEPLSPREKLMALLHNTYRSEFLYGLQVHGSHFKAATQLAQSVVVKRIQRPLSGFGLAQLVERVEADLADSGRADVSIHHPER